MNPNLFDCFWLKLFVVNVRLDLLYHRVRYVVLVVVKEALEELAGVLQHSLARLPVVVNLGWRREGDRLSYLHTHTFRGALSNAACTAYGKPHTQQYAHKLSHT